MALRLDTRIRIDRETQTGTSDLNAPIMEWLTHLRAWAQVDFAEGDEVHAASQTYETRLATVTMRWHSDVKVTDRVVIDGTAFNILSVRPIGRRKWTELKIRYTA